MIDYIIIPETGLGNGTGHLVRSMDLARNLARSALFITHEHRSDIAKRYPQLAEITVCGPEIFDVPATSSKKIFIVDKPIFSQKELQMLSLHGLVIGIDLRGSALVRLPFVIDILPRLKENKTWKKANITEPGFMKLPQKKRETTISFNKILVAFGGEDVGNLRIELIRSRILEKEFPAAQVNILNGPRMNALTIALPAGWTEIPPQKNLSEHLHSWDLVITSFGLTAFEASAAGCAVLLLNPSSYHEALSHKAGFSSFGVKKVSEHLFARYIRAYSGKIPEYKHVAALPSGPESLASFLKDVPYSGPCVCPACCGTGNRVLARFPNRTFFECTTCGIWFQYLFAQQTIQYNEAYFFEAYEKQYGKTYLDDFSHIKAMGGQRLDKICTLGYGKQPLRLLDIGCAYGPFLQAASERGFSVQGCDISPDAVSWVKENLGFPAQSGDIRIKTDADFGGKLDIVTLWYVIEHFSDLHRLLATLNSLIKQNGLLCVSTPSGSGISARARRLDFLKQSPLDHYTIWRPPTISRLLKLYGFKLRSIRITGHHAERFPFPLGTKIFSSMSNFFSRVLRLGDTFELYAEKIAEAPTVFTKESV